MVTPLYLILETSRHRRSFTTPCIRTQTFVSHEPKEVQFKFGFTNNVSAICRALRFVLMGNRAFAARARDSRMCYNKVGSELILFNMFCMLLKVKVVKFRRRMISQQLRLHTPLLKDKLIHTCRESKYEKQYWLVKAVATPCIFLLLQLFTGFSSDPTT